MTDIEDQTLIIEHPSIISPQQGVAKWAIYCHFEDPPAGGDEKSFVFIKVMRFLSSFEMTFYVFCNTISREDV